MDAHAAHHPRSLHVISREKLQTPVGLPGWVCMYIALPNHY